MNFVAYTPATGEIFRRGDCQEVDFSAQAGDGAVLAGQGARETHYVFASTITAYTSGQAAAKAARPFHRCEWSNESFAWLDLRTLDERKADKWEAIKRARAAAIDAPLTPAYGVFDSYAEARANITDAVLLAQTLAGMGQAVAIAYTLADNTVVTLDLTKMVTVGLTLGSKVQTVRGIATGLRTQIEAATTVTLLEAIVWPA